MEEGFYDETVYDDATGTYRSPFDMAEAATYPSDSEDDE